MNNNPILNDILQELIASDCIINFLYKKDRQKMGNQQGKKLPKVNKTQIQVASMKSKYHLELMKGRKEAEIIKSEKQLVGKIKSPSRNKTEEILIAERIINALKYAQACNYLMSYCASLKPQANYIAENMNNPQKLKPYLGMIYSLMYAAQTMGLSSLKEFRDLMRALNDPQTLTVYVNKQIMDLLFPHPTPAELNQYFLQMSQRNAIPLEEINIIGHKFTQNIDIKPTNQPTFSQLQKKIGDQLAKNLNNGGQSGQGGQNWGGQSGQNGQGQNQGQGWSGNNYGPNGQGWSGNYRPNNQDWSGYNGGMGQPGNQWQGGMNVPVGGNTGGNNYVSPGTLSPSNLGPDFYTPAKIQPAKDLPLPNVVPQQSKMSIKDINDIMYYPEIPQPTFKVDPDFNELCEKIKVGL